MMIQMIEKADRFRHGVVGSLLCLFLCMASWAQAASSLKPDPIDEESYGESFTAVAEFEDGSYVLLQYVFTNAGFGDGKAACRALIVPPGGKGKNSAIKVDRDEWSYNAGSNSLNVGKCVLKSSGNQTRFVAKTGEVTASLKLNAGIRSLRTPGHRIKSDGKFYESEILVPWATATATLSTGGKVWKINGHGYLDHTRSNALLKNLANRWIRFRGFRGTSPVLFEVRYPPRGAYKAWIWSDGKARPIKGGNIKTKGKSSSLSIALQTDKGAAQIKARKVIYRYKPAKQYGLLGRLAKPWVGDPEIITSQAELTLGDGSVVKGVLEEARFAD